MSKRNFTNLSFVKKKKKHTKFKQYNTTKMDAKIFYKTKQKKINNLFRK